MDCSLSSAQAVWNISGWKMVLQKYNMSDGGCTQGNMYVGPHCGGLENAQWWSGGLKPSHLSVIRGTFVSGGVKEKDQGLCVFSWSANPAWHDRSCPGVGKNGIQPKTTEKCTIVTLLKHLQWNKMWFGQKHLPAGNVGWGWGGLWSSHNLSTEKCTNVTLETLAVKQNLFDLSLKTFHKIFHKKSCCLT